MKRTWLTFLTGTIILASALTGCGGNGPKVVDPKDKAPEAPNIKVIDPFTYKVGTVEVKVQELAGYSFKNPASFFNSTGMAKFGNDLLIGENPGNDKRRQMRAVKVDGAKIYPDTKLFKDGIYTDKESVSQVLAADKNYIYFSSAPNIRSLKDGKSEIAINRPGMTGSTGHRLAITPDEKTAFELFQSVRKLDIKDGKLVNPQPPFLQEKPLIGPFDYHITGIAADNDKVYVSGSNKDKIMKLAIFDHQGKLLNWAEAPKKANNYAWNLGLTAKYIIAISERYEDMLIWTKDGKLIGSISANKALGDGVTAFDLIGWSDDSVIINGYKSIPKGQEGSSADSTGYDFHFYMVTFK